MLKFLSRRFRGGIHPESYKNLTNAQGIDQHFWPRNVFLSLQLRNGAMLMPLVKPGDTVSRGQLVAKGRNDMVAPIHAPVNGVVTGITQHFSSHPAKLKCDTIIIRANGDRRWGESHKPQNYLSLDAEEIIARVRDAGIVGLGGAGFPTVAKIQFARKGGAHTLVINGGECEPYLTCDDVAMQQYAAEVIAGVKLLLKASGTHKALIGVEDNKPAALEQLRLAAAESDEIEVHAAPSIYPMGSERHLIKYLTGAVVPAGGHAGMLGILVHNIATARAVYQAVRFQRPLVSRVITVSGKGIAAPRNVEVPIGTPVSELLEYCGGVSDSTARLLFGGPMMGQVISSPYIPIDKTVGGILALTEEEVRPRPQSECIRCGQCVRACPMGLMPFQMAAYARLSDFSKTEALGVGHCLSCGACSYVCPSALPLVQYFQFAKGSINANRLKAQRSATAKQLNEERVQRLAKEAEAKAAAKAAKAAARKRPARATAQESES
ncbi:electron transport complex subunit RsxC [Shewanella sp. C32]|uniref:Ion-translocating oxidoreductase complex subunit C n=1 Tax=Shewanella electrica TaxID=515560 RepID=A0ABT2FHV8_9GAMM|nr:electron transport complex subunit RsxC [Shewanella electrica]MCH1924015.1 electron transport complex subunit RsxC [Shewanella electrica]MCS4555918.1 electron transport complex subunit RsxC [Shewanella electrica]